VTSILEGIVARTRTDLEQRMRARPLAALPVHRAPPPRSFESALRIGSVSLIAELKPRSPSRGILRSGDGLERIAECYVPYASAISVLCETPHFGGGYPLLQRVRSLVNTPLLAKDFVVDEYQVHEARAHGADSILLMVSVLAEPELRQLLSTARSLGMEPLVETHDDDELDVALRAGARVIGVNSRDLRTLEIDLPRARERLRKVPADRVRVAESGVETQHDVIALQGLADAVLIGSSLMSAPDPAARIEELGWTSS